MVRPLAGKPEAPVEVSLILVKVFFELRITFMRAFIERAGARALVAVAFASLLLLAFPPPFLAPAAQAMRATTQGLASFSLPEVSWDFLKPEPAGSNAGQRADQKNAANLGKLNPDASLPTDSRYQE